MVDKLHSIEGNVAGQFAKSWPVVGKDEGSFVNK